MALPDLLAGHLDTIISNHVEPAALAVDRTGRFPRDTIDAMGKAGLLGLVSASAVGGAGGTLADASGVVRRLAEHCGSTATVVCMHYCASAVLEQFGDTETRTAIAQGRHLSTLAFSEAESRSHFWAPVSTARREGAGVVLDARKSWITSAGEADSYVWSSRPLAAAGASTLWLVPARSAGLRQPAPYDGLGLRGNASSPVLGEQVTVPSGHQLGEDGKGFDIMMGTVLPWFVTLNASCSVGLMDGALARAVAHVGATRHQHLDSTLADLPTVRAYLAKARVRADMARCLLDDTVAAIAAGRPDTMLRVLEVKAAAADAALEVTELAMRVCGGAAFRKQGGIERMFRDARAASVMAPTSDILYDLLGKAVTGLPLF